MTDVVFYLKAFPGQRERSLPWKTDVKLIGLDPGSMGIACEGSDRLCSTAFSRMHQALKSPSGTVMPNLLSRFARGLAVERVAFVGFSAAHGFLNPLLANDDDRAMTNAVLMLDTCFGGGKTGFQKALRDSSKGRMLSVWVTSHDGSPWERASLVQSGTHCFETQVLQPTGLDARRLEACPITPTPVGCFKVGGSSSLAWWLRYVEGTKAQLPHWELGKLQAPVVEAFLLPWLNGDLDSTSEVLAEWKGPVFLALAALLGFSVGLRATR